MSSVVSKSHNCPYRNRPHKNLAFVVYSNGHYCYSCNKGTIKDDSFYVFNKSIARIEAVDDLLLPNNTTNVKEFPTHIKAWLYKYYIFDDIIYKHNIRYCPYVYFKTSSGQVYEGESLLYPVIEDMEIVAYQRRFFPDKQFFSKNLHKHIVEFGNSDSDEIVLVEDYLSAIRISEVVNCIWLSGVHLTASVKTYIVQNYNNISIWLDSDEAGQSGAKKIMDSLNDELVKRSRWFSFGTNRNMSLKNIVTELDPKFYSKTELKEILWSQQ